MRGTAPPRACPPLVAELILDYGESRDAGDGTRTYALTRASIRTLRHRAGPTLVKALEPYRSRNADVIATTGRVITGAYAAEPLFR